MPAPVVQRLNTAFVKAFNSPDVKAKMRTIGLVYTPYTTPPELAKYVMNQRDMYRKLAADLNMVGE